VGEALEAEHLPGVVEARIVVGDGARAGGQVLGPPVLLRQEQVTVGRAGVKGQGAPVCKREGKENGESETNVSAGSVVRAVSPRLCLISTVWSESSKELYIIQDLRTRLKYLTSIWRTPHQVRTASL